MMADMVIVFMNSARKKRAKRIDGVLGVEAADQLLLGLDEVERRAVELGGGGDEEDDERHARRWPRGSSSQHASCAATMPLVRERAGDAGRRRATDRPRAAS